MQNQKHFNHDLNKSLSFTDQTKQFRRNLTYKSSEIEKIQHDYGREVSLSPDETLLLEKYRQANNDRRYQALMSLLKTDDTDK